jgi:hypothetical protein
MNAVTRWKTIATIAVAFSAGNLFATACQNSGVVKAGDGTTEDGTPGGGDGSTPPPDLSSVEADVASIKCVLRYFENADQDEYPGHPHDELREDYVIEANSACGL